MKLSMFKVFLIVIAGMAFFLPSLVTSYCDGPQSLLVAEGDNATFSSRCVLYIHHHPFSELCFDDEIVWQWFYQIFPEQPMLISSDDEVNEQFADRFSVRSSYSTSYLHISNVSTSDSGQYFCRMYLPDLDFYFDSHKAELSVSKKVGNHTSLRLRSPLRCEDISPRNEEHQAGDQVILTCIPPAESEGMVRAINWSLPGDSAFGGTQYLTPCQHHSYTVTRILQNKDNCKQFRCDASPSDMFENTDDAHCVVLPLKIPVSISPELAFAAIGGQVEFSCSTEGETTASRFVWWKQRGDTKERSEINSTEKRFQVGASGKTLTVSPVLAEDDGTQILCEVWYEMDCGKPSSWATVKVGDLETTPSQRGTETPPGVGAQDDSGAAVGGAAVGCFLAGVAITSLVALAVRRKVFKKRAVPTPRKATAPDLKKVVRYTPACSVERDKPADVDDSMVYENMETGPVQVDDDVYEIPNPKC